jgi:glycosyltransferase involved in cell wall biosynthesis
MKVLINALGANMGGALRHLTSFLPALGQTDSTNDYVLLCRESVKLPHVARNIRVERVSDHGAASPLLRLVKDICWLPLRACSDGFTALVTLTNLGPIWTPTPHIVFQRDANYFSPYFAAQVDRRTRLATVLRRSIAVAMMKRAAVIVTPSAAMAELIRKSCPSLTHKRFATIHHGFSFDCFQKPTSTPVKLPEDGNLRLLYPTHPGPHKGFEILFDAAALLRSSLDRFVLYVTIEHSDWPSGIRKYQEQIDRLHLHNWVRFVGRIPQEQMESLYRTADVVVFPSLSESFGFPMLESLAFGVPVVAADTPVNREICDEGAVYYPPLDAHTAASMISALSVSAIRDSYAEKARARFSSVDWSWERYTRQFTTILKEVA